MKIDDMTIGELKQILSMVPTEASTLEPWVLGQKYLIRTVTHYATGRLIFVGLQELVLEDAAWIADTGRYSDALLKGELTEVEPSNGPKIIGRGSIIDAELWQHELPKEQQ